MGTFRARVVNYDGSDAAAGAPSRGASECSTAIARTHDFCARRDRGREHSRAHVLDAPGQQRDAPTSWTRTRLRRRPGVLRRATSGIASGTLPTLAPPGGTRHRAGCGRDRRAWEQGTASNIVPRTPPIRRPNNNGCYLVPARPRRFEATTRTREPYTEGRRRQWLLLADAREINQR